LFINHWAIDRAIFFCGYTIHFFHCSIHPDCICLDFKLKLRSLPNFRVDANFTLQLLNDEFRDSEAKSHTSLVYFFGLVKFPKKLKQSLYSFLLYSNPCISHSGNEAFILILKRHCDASFECKLCCIANEVE
jgi:hypothetical protein